QKSFSKGHSCSSHGVRGSDMAIASESPFLTESGVVIKYDAGMKAILCFNSHTGLIYAVEQQDGLPVTRWLEGEGPLPPPDIYAGTLGAGWLTPMSQAIYPCPHLLPSPNSWFAVSSPTKPILINWLITGRCPLACKYCYAEDLMRNETLEPK